MKNTFRLGCIVKKPQAPTRFLGYLIVVWTTVLSDWSGFLNVILMLSAITCMVSDLKFASIVLFSISLVICLLRLITNKDDKQLSIKIFNVIITIILLLSQIF
jgi:hypothetical protein